MQTKDHLALGHFLLERFDNAALHHHARAFLLGCVEPDYNMVTYIRGIRGHQKFRGHNAENSLAHLTKCMFRFQETGLNSAWDYFSLGTMLHYVADAFTWPHNAFWSGNLIQHASYEQELHGAFLRELHKKGNAKRETETLPPLEYLHCTHSAYAAKRHGTETDCRYIIRVCMVLLLESLCWTAQGKDQREEESYYEGAYHHRLVQARH